MLKNLRKLKRQQVLLSFWIFSLQFRPNVYQSSSLYLIDRTKSHAPIFWFCFLPDDKFSWLYFLLTVAGYGFSDSHIGPKLRKYSKTSKLFHVKNLHTGPNIDKKCGVFFSISQTLQFLNLFLNINRGFILFCPWLRLCLDMAWLAPRLSSYLCGWNNSVVNIGCFSANVHRANSPRFSWHRRTKPLLRSTTLPWHYKRRAFAVMCAVQEKMGKNQHCIAARAKHLVFTIRNLGKYL